MRELVILKEAFNLFSTMRDEGLELDGHTFVHLLSVCSEIQNVEMGIFVHWYIEINGITVDVYVQNVLLDMYAKGGKLSTNSLLFNIMVDKNVISWTSMITTCAKHGLVDLAWDTFNKMPMRNVVSWNSMMSCYL